MSHLELRRHSYEITTLYEKDIDGDMMFELVDEFEIVRTYIDKDQANQIITHLKQQFDL